jgi:4-hydroxy-4-methyl-2-oxoglutarate aldolase
MTHVSREVLEAFKTFDSPTIFNAVVLKLGLPNEDYTDYRIRSLLPELGPFIGYAVTAEVTTNDADSLALPWEDYYGQIDAVEGPVVALIKDVDSRPGRGASFGDGMARLHKRLGVVGAIVDGTVRDLEGIRQVGLPIYAWGRVPGHGVFNVTRVNVPLTIGQMRVGPGDLVFADGDGCVRIPLQHAEEVLALAGQVREKEADIFALYDSPDFSFAAWKASLG